MPCWPATSKVLKRATISSTPERLARPRSTRRMGLSEAGSGRGLIAFLRQRQGGDGGGDDAGTTGGGRKFEVTGHQPEAVAPPCGPETIERQL